MKILVLSDLHAEFADFTPDPQVLKLVDAVVLAGDIQTARKVAGWARGKFPDLPIVYVAGNHELYDGHWNETLDLIREQARLFDVHFLENDCVTLEGIRFLGATFWTDFEFFGEGKKASAMVEADRVMMDFGSIADCTPQATIERHLRSRAWLDGELSQPGSPLNRVVVTHHYPDKNSCPAQYLSDLTTAAFGSQLPADFMDRAGLWIHGHTHRSALYRVGNCRVVCNPRGYPVGRLRSDYENMSFNPCLVMEQASNGQWAPMDLRGLL